MDKHALALLDAANSWSWPPMSRILQSGAISTHSKFKAVTPKLLAGFISKSVKQGGTLLNQFWFIVGGCHPKLEENSQSILLLFWYGHILSAGISAVQKLRLTEFSSPNQTELKLFEGLDQDAIDFDPIFALAAELFTHLGVACMRSPLYT